ncbi:MAG: hypothetical protein GF331_04655, partial [Chitinivibrionales bacterium]|nr:hypothetical protein [Chitinivibrionales bacterium]
MGHAMHYEVHEDSEKRLLVIVTHGGADAQGFEDYTRDILAHPLCGPGWIVLVDHRDLDFSGLTRQDVERYRNFCATHLAPTDTSASEGIRVASVMGDGMAYGIARQWEIPLKSEVSFMHRTFLSYSEAVEWLGV